MELINGINWAVELEQPEDREISFSATLECKTAKEGKGTKFAVLSAKGKYLAGDILDNEDELEPDLYYDIKLTQACNAVIPADPKLDGIYDIRFVGRAWIDTREPEEGQTKHPRVYLNGHDFKFTKKKNLIKK